MGPSNSSCLSTTTIFHFHDYGRKSSSLVGGSSKTSHLVGQVGASMGGFGVAWSSNRVHYVHSWRIGHGVSFLRATDSSRENGKIYGQIQYYFPISFQLNLSS